MTRDPRPYDLVVAMCPACGTIVEFVSFLSPHAWYRVFGLDDVPCDVAGDFTEATVCTGCRRGWLLHRAWNSVGAYLDTVDDAQVVAFDEVGNPTPPLFSGTVPECADFVDRSAPVDAVAIVASNYGGVSVRYAPPHRVSRIDQEVGAVVTRIGDAAARRRAQFADLGIDIDAIERELREGIAGLEGGAGGREDGHAWFRWKRVVDERVARRAFELALERDWPCPLIEWLIATRGDVDAARRHADAPCVLWLLGDDPERWVYAPARSTLVSLLAAELPGEGWGHGAVRVPLWRVLDELAITDEGFVLANGRPVAQLLPLDACGELDPSDVL